LKIKNFPYKLFKIVKVIAICVPSNFVDGTGVARIFDWEGPKLEKNFVTFFGDVMVMTSLK